MIVNADEFSNLIKQDNRNNTEEVFRMAKVTSYTSGKVYLTFYGEETQRAKNYKRLSSYSPNVGDTVICAKLNGSYTILGKVV